MQQDFIRISSLPRILACPSSMAPVDHPYDPPSEMAALGTAAHEALAALPVGVVPDLERIAEKHRVDCDELEHLYRNGCDAWDELGLDLEHCRVEMRLDGGPIKGTADVVYHDGIDAVVIDWKSNRVKRAYRPQLTGYAAALMNNFVPPESGKVIIVTVWLRFGEWDRVHVGQTEIDRLYDDIESAKRAVGKRYAPGDTCTYCPRQLVCQAKHEYLVSAAAALGHSPHVEFTRDTLGLLYAKSKAMRKALDHYDDALKLALQDGPIDTPDGVIEFRELKRDRIDPALAWSILQEAGLSERDLADCVTLSKTKAMKLVGKDAKRGTKAAVRATVYAQLKDAGAIKTSVSDAVSFQKGE